MFKNLVINLFSLSVHYFVAPRYILFSFNNIFFFRNNKEKRDKNGNVDELYCTFGVLFYFLLIQNGIKK